MIEKIREYIEECPYLDEFAKVNVNYLSDKNMTYSVNEGVGYDPVVKPFMTGNKMQFQFSFDARFKWNDEVSTNIDNSKFFEKFRNWLEENNNKKILPNIEGIKSEKIKAITNGYIFTTTGDEAIYRISCIFYYLEEGNIWK